MATLRKLDERLEALIAWRVSKLRVLAAETACAYWRERTERPLSERLNFWRGPRQDARSGFRSYPASPDGIVHRWPRA